jgi:hypothetical protein
MGQGHAVTVTMEQRSLEFTFQKPDLPAESRLRDPQERRSTCQTSQFCDVHEGSYVADFHGRGSSA